MVFPIPAMDLAELVPIPRGFHGDYFSCLMAPDMIQYRCREIRDSTLTMQLQREKTARQIAL
jgi:hypothetical protein